jgi:hypothetical protein
LWPSTLGVFALACAVFAASAALIRLPPAWMTFEFCQYAEIGRNLAVDGRFDTRLIEPMALAYVDRHRVVDPAHPPSRWPVIDRFPLPCLVVASLMKAFGPTSAVAAWANGLALAGLAAVLHVLVRRRHGPLWALAASLLLVLNPAVFGYFALLGTPDPLFALLFTLTLLAWQPLGGSTARPSIVAAVQFGLLGGLSYLARFNAVLFLVPLMAVIAWRRHGRTLAVSGLVATAVVTPLLAYNVAQFGRPTVSIYSAWNLLDRIGAYRVEPWLYYQLPSVLDALRAHPAGLFSKWGHNLFVVVPSRLWTLWDLLLLWPLTLLAVVGLLRRRSVADRWLAWAVGLFVFQLVVFSALRLEFEPRLSPHHGRYFFWFAPFALLLAIDGLGCGHCGRARAARPVRAHLAGLDSRQPAPVQPRPRPGAQGRRAGGWALRDRRLQPAPDAGLELRTPEHLAPRRPRRAGAHATALPHAARVSVHRPQLQRHRARPALGLAGQPAARLHDALGTGSPAPLHLRVATPAHAAPDVHLPASQRPAAEPDRARASWTGSGRETRCTVPGTHDENRSAGVAT